MLTCFFDGACGPKNPGGTCAFGAIVYRHGVPIWEHAGVHVPEIEGQTSNNLGEYLAFEAVLDWILEGKLDFEEIKIFGDSQLVVQQMTGKWRLKGGTYIDVARRSQEKLSRFRSPPLIKWIPREQNVEADKLSKRHLPKW